MHTPTKAYLLLALLPFALANMVSQISDGQVQEPAEAPAVVAPKIAIAPTSAPVAAASPPPPTSTSTFIPAATSPPLSPPPALKEAGAVAAPPIANTSIPAPARIEEAATTAPILIAPAPAANITIPHHHVNHETSHPSASTGNVLPVENGTAPTVPVVPTLPAVASQASTSGEGSPREAGTTQAASKGVAARLGVSAGFGALGVIGLAVMLS
ncbi:hypothetical protein HO133_003488 [Letharia lupina]|uniref:Uncharacterized protein n=2 Tax=Letharia TaxID=112415 RepID=A0A8H6F9X0_9LECA|nr:uncharacterized protein HO133_003488 [Letharia lupina]XP_037160854.1 uncharacterized protein HO173_010383 [Letharia columbiana]KAF6220356.1 hypothetical protein HO133_003488 [Letharia lupina]KAF6231422.1 hypothetical protein HO173_010383 [Letharia columbiana]